MNLKVIIPKYFPKVMYILLMRVYFYVTYSGATGLSKRNKLTGRVVADYHVLEKGLTMPDTRLGFGRARVLNVIEYCNKFISKYGANDAQIAHAIATVLEYKQFHEENNYQLDEEVLSEISNLQNKFKNIHPSHQLLGTREDYFKSAHDSFESFSNSRRSIRNYTKEDVSLDVIKKAIKLARNAPSVCNRQSVRVHVYSKQETVQNILTTQGGNRGFGHLANKVIVITAQLGAMHGLYERNQAFVDGGIWAMNMLYALHHYKVAACPLNCSNSPKKDKLLRKYGKIDKSETFIMLISVGYPPEEFKLASSPRLSVDEMASFN